MTRKKSRSRLSLIQFPNNKSHRLLIKLQSQSLSNKLLIQITLLVALLVKQSRRKSYSQSMMIRWVTTNQSTILINSMLITITTNTMRGTLIRFISSNPTTMEVRKVSFRSPSSIPIQRQFTNHNQLLINKRSLLHPKSQRCHFKLNNSRTR